MIKLPAGMSARRATMADLETTLQLLNACEIAESGEPDFTLDELRHEWELGDPSERFTLVAGADGTLAGYLDVSHSAHVNVDADIYVHPERTGLGLGTWLVRESEKQARQHIESAPAGARVVLRNVVNGQNAAACALLEGEGYLPVRRFWRMMIDFDAPPPAPDWPDGIKVRSCIAGQDEPAMYAAVSEAFRDHWSMGPTNYEDWLRRKKSDSWDASLWFQARDGDQIAGAAVCRIMDQMGWVSDLAVRRPWRRRGLGRALLLHAFGEFYRRGFRTVALGVDSENATGATGLYESVGMREVRTYVFYEKVLRDGEPWSDEETDE